jgi:capsular exopolysaccharide synthesis family protein
MSRLFEALSNVEAKHHLLGVVPLTVTPPGTDLRERIAVEADPPLSAQELEREYCSPDVPSPDEAPSVVTAVKADRSEYAQESVLNEVPTKPIETVEERSVLVKALPESRLVALTDPNCLGAEKFRALVTRLDHLRMKHELGSFQVTSSVINEGKTLVAANVAVTLAKYSGSKTLLIEGDLRRPSLAALLGLSELSGLSHWWSGRDRELASFIHKLDDMPLWFLAAGKPCDRPSDVLRSARFERAFTQLARQFEWIVVDSTPMLPIVDVNLWSKLVDGTLLVLREGLTPIKTLKKGLQALNHPKLIGVVLNEVSESDQENYGDQYYGASKPAAGRVDKMS